MNNYTPTVFTTINSVPKEYHIIDHYFHKRRTVLLCESVTEDVATRVSLQLEELAEKSSDPIVLRINSGGGGVYDGLAILDCMNYIKDERHIEITTFAYGMAASMGAFLLAAGTPGKRFASVNTQILIHQPLGGASGQATEIEIMARHILETKLHLAKLLSENCGKPVEELVADMERDRWMTAKQALSYGLIDHIGFPSKED